MEIKLEVKGDEEVEGIMGFLKNEKR